MSPKVISSFDVFAKEYPTLASSNSSGERVEALKTYFKNGGVISLAKSTAQWPKLIYPSFKRVQDQLKELEILHDIFIKKHNDWKTKEFNAKIYYAKNEVMKFAEPIYWKHLGKILTDRDYKEDAKNVKLPANLIADKRWRPMIKTFVNDIEYRKQLVETVQHSMVYEKNKEVAAYAKELQEFRQNISNKKLGQIQEKLLELESQIKSLQEMQKWAKE